jgi:hypothetical protein
LKTVAEEREGERERERERECAYKVEMDGGFLHERDALKPPSVQAFVNPQSRQSRRR